MTYRVIQWATGGVGQAAIQGIAAHLELELVGCWVHSEAKAGRDAGELAGIEPLGVAATNDVDALLALDADCVVYAPLMPDEALVCRLLEAGLDVVTPLGWVYPRAKDVDAARHGHPPGWHHRAVPVDGVGADGVDHPCAGGGVQRHPDVRRS